MNHDPASKFPRQECDREFREWVRTNGLRVLIEFEGRDAAGKDGAIERIIEYLNGVVRTVALPAPTEREQGQWYFQRLISAPHRLAASSTAVPRATTQRMPEWNSTARRRRVTLWGHAYRDRESGRFRAAVSRRISSQQQQDELRGTLKTSEHGPTLVRPRHA